MNPLLSFARSKQKDMIALIREMVECESPSDDPAALNRFCDLFASTIGDIAKVQRLGGRNGRHLRCEFNLPWRKKQGRILALGHSDTVWPLGTLKTMPFREQGGRLWGPGVLDMKSGLAFFVFAMRGLRELDIPVARKVVLQVNADEEVGSDTSRAHTEAAARASDFVLVLEPGTGLEGKLKTSRKGIGDYTVTVRGRAAHAGLDFSAGANAIVELARQIESIAGFTKLERGITVSPGVVRGGTRTNVVPAEARVEIDIRIVRAKDALYLQKQFGSMKPFDKRCVIEVSGGMNRPPMERSKGIVALLRDAQRLGREIGVKVEESSTGGGSDGNFTAALGVPTLDGLGGVGEGAHAMNESILIDRMADRTALLAALAARP
jgi:glutamate carboxypeptidase